MRAWDVGPLVAADPRPAGNLYTYLLLSDGCPA